MRKFICIIITFCICCLPIISLAEIPTNLQQEQENLKNQIQESNDNLGEVQNELSENLQEVQKLDESISASQEEISKLDSQLDEIQSYVDEVQSKLDVEEEKYNKQKETLEKRLVAMYEAGDTEYLEVILSSKNVSDFLSNYYLVSEVASYDSLMLEEVAQKKDEIDDIKKALEDKQKELAETKHTQTKTAKILENTKKVRNNYIAQLSESEKEIQAQIDQYNARFSEINRQILELTKGGIDSQYIGGELAWPIPGYTRITSKFGMRTHPITGVYKLHTGCDVGAPKGAEFVAANDGIVIKASYNSAYGNMVIIDHGGGISTLYAHGSEILVQEGQVVTRNQPVLKVGSTGYSTGPHAHFEVRINGVVTDPLPYITNGLIPQTQNQNNGENNNSGN